MDRAIDIHIYDMLGKEQSFTSLRALVEFLRNEGKFWQDQYESLSDKANANATINQRNMLNNAANDIVKLIDEGLDDNELQQRVERLVNPIAQPGNNWVWSEQPSVEPFIGLNEEYGKEAADAFLRFVTKKQPSDMSVTPKFIGVMAGYEFVFQDSELLKRRNGEKASLNRLRTRMSDTVSQLTGEFEEFKNQFTGWDKDTRVDWGEFKDKSSGDFDAQVLHQEKDFAALIERSREKASELELLYREKLKLEKPAQYWDTRADILRRQGRIFLTMLVIAVSVGLFMFVSVFDSWLAGQHIGIKLNTIQGIIMFGTILAVYGFFIRVVSKLTFSSYHLMRDAEERNLLTYLYLALVHEGKIDDKSLDKVVQALFSRSETGLLGGESGPTMPTSPTELLGGMKNSNIG